MTATSSLLCIVGGFNFKQEDDKIEGKGNMIFNGRITIRHKSNGAIYASAIFMYFTLDNKLKIAVRVGDPSQYRVNWNPASKEQIRANVKVNKYSQITKTALLCGPITYTIADGTEIKINFELNRYDNIVMVVSFPADTKKLIVDLSKSYDTQIGFFA